MKIIDMGNEVTLAAMANPAAVTATAALGSSVDLLGYQGKVKICLAIGAITGTTPTLDIKVQDSADNSTFADLASPVAFGQKTNQTNSVDSVAIDTRACRRYVKLYATAGGTTPSFTLSAVAIGQKQTI